MFQQAQAMDALLLGRRTYEIFAGYSPRAPTEEPLHRVAQPGAENTSPVGTLSEPLAWAGTLARSR